MVNFKQLLERATKSDHPEPDWEAILEIVEEIKTKSTSIKSAMKEFRKHLLDSNGTTVYYTLVVLESVMKNCGSDIHKEILSTEFMNVMKGVVTSSKDGKSEKAVDKALELIGEWKVAFGQQAGYKAVSDAFSELQREGYHIPETEIASAAFIKKPPEFMLGDRCFMCRTEFNRFKGAFRHHCRNCGKSVCAGCSGKRVALPQFGIDQPTRVCDICFKKVDKPGSDSTTTSASDTSDLPPEYLMSSLAQESQQPSGSRDSELKIQEEDDLQLAIAMSLNEQENKAKAQKTTSSSSRSSSQPPPPRSTTPSAPPPAPSTLYATIVHDSVAPTNVSTGPTYTNGTKEQETENDPLARYLDRSYWEQRREQQSGGGDTRSRSPASRRKGASTTTTTSSAVNGVGPEAVILTEGSTGSPLAESVRKTIEMFIQRMHQVNSAGGSVATDPVVLSLYQNLNAMQPQLLKQIDEVQQKKAHQESLIQKLNEAKEARVTLDRMRREHLDKIRQQEEEQALLARMQMEQKLALLRQQKQEQLAYQHSLQQQRLETLQTQRTEYEQKLQLQRDLERKMLIEQEQKILQHQFGGVSPQTLRKPPPPQVSSAAQYQPPAAPPLSGAVPPMSMEPPPSLAMQTLTLHDPTQAPPLPSKLSYNPPSMDPTPPPPYQPLSLPTESGSYLSYQQQQPPPHATGLPPQPSSLPAQPSMTGLQLPSMIPQQPLSLDSSPAISPGVPQQPPSLGQQGPSSLEYQQTQPAYNQPPQSMYGQQTTQPAQQVYSQPPQPAQPAYSQPQQPAQPTYSQPPQPAQPAYSQPQQPAQPAYSQPQQPAQPVFNQPQQPVQPVYSQPQQPIQPVYNQPVQPPYNQPQQPAQPVYNQPPQQGYNQPPPQQVPYSGYTGYQGDAPPQQYPGGANQNGFGRPRQESEPPLISFD